jgi:alkanesulfonate monooxygenase SsuD/methylene tetrahydromethanopterin reductase-like flavin-dependent oxidoreductase (luciferase family)
MMDTLRACRALWRDAPASFASPTATFDSLWCEPRPAQPDGVPIWFGVAPSTRHAAHVAELGAGWLPVGVDLAAMRDGAAKIRAAFAAAGRDPASLGVRANVPPALDAAGRIDLDRTLAESAPAAVAGGATVLAYPIAAYVRRPEELDAFVRRVAKG